MSKTYKLTYFDVRGRGEVARYLFALAGVKYEDNRVSKENWPTEKPKTPFGQIPVLEVDGVQVCQSDAINRYLGREFGYYGSSNLEGALIDAVLGCCADVGKELVTVAFHTKEEDKPEAKKKFLENEFVRLVAYLERQLGDNDWLVGSKVSVADISIYHFFTDYISFLFGKDSWSANSKLTGLADRVAALPQIQEWIAKRPVTLN